MSMLEQLSALTADIDTNIAGDLISTGAQIRVRVGETTHTPVDGTATFARFPNAVITRWTRRQQGDKQVISATITTKGEQIGLIGDEAKEILLPCYLMPQFLTWNDWVHLLNVEFQNVNVETALEIEKMLDKSGFTAYVPRAMPGQDIRERTTETLYDREAPGRSLVDRHASGVKLSTFTILPDSREEANKTMYLKDGEEQNRWGFTSFADTLMYNMRQALDAHGLPMDTEDRAEIVRQRNSALSVLTGTDPETGYSTRPTLGYLTFAGINPSTSKQYEEMNLFPNKDETAPAAKNTDTGDNPEAEEPF